MWYEPQACQLLPPVLIQQHVAFAFNPGMRDGGEAFKSQTVLCWYFHPPQKSEQRQRPRQAIIGSTRGDIEVFGKPKCFQCSL